MTPDAPDDHRGGKPTKNLPFGCAGVPVHPETSMRDIDDMLL
ncbi:hypothetical protein [Novosphingobium sp.]